MLVYNAVHEAAHEVEASFGDVHLDDAGIRELELYRARRALAYLKERIGNERMLDLLVEDLDAATEQVREWVAASDGEWQSGALEMRVPGPGAAFFEDWFMGNMKQQHEALFRAGHPDHLMNHPTGPGRAEVIENVGEDELPWHFFLDFKGTEFDFPTPWDPSYPHAFGVLINDRDGLRIGSAMHELRDTDDDRLEVKLTIHLPAAAPQSLVEGHLRHFASAIAARAFRRAASIILAVPGKSTGLVRPWPCRVALTALADTSADLLARRRAARGHPAAQPSAARVAASAGTNWVSRRSGWLVGMDCRWCTASRPRRG